MPKGDQQKKSPNPLLIVSAATGAIVIVAILAVTFLNGDKTNVDDLFNQSNNKPDSAAFRYVTSAALHSGSLNAPVTITLFEDFHCSACAYLNSTMIPEVERRFVQTGQARIEFRHFVHYGDDSLIAAEAVECVNEQDVEFGTNNFREFHDLMFANQLSALEPRLSQFAREVGIQNISAFDSCISSGRYAEKVRESTMWIMQQGATGTPAILIGDQLYVGVPPIEAFEQAIEAN